MVAGHCVVPVAMADADPPFEGRWTAENRSLTLDISRCGDGWCGVEVTAESCGRTILRARSQPEQGGVVIGRLDLAAKAQPYTVSMDLFERGPGASYVLHIRGSSSDSFSLARRVFPYMVAFARTGDAVCRPDPKVS
jgi:hypothetical protein